MPTAVWNMPLPIGLEVRGKKYYSDTVFLTTFPKLTVEGHVLRKALQKPIGSFEFVVQPGDKVSVHSGHK